MREGRTKERSGGIYKIGRIIIYDIMIPLGLKLDKQHTSLDNVLHDTLNIDSKSFVGGTHSFATIIGDSDFDRLLHICVAVPKKRPMTIKRRRQPSRK